MGTPGQRATVGNQEMLIKSSPGLIGDKGPSEGKAEKTQEHSVSHCFTVTLETQHRPRQRVPSSWGRQQHAVGGGRRLR